MEFDESSIIMIVEQWSYQLPVTTTDNVTKPLLKGLFT